MSKVYLLTGIIASGKSTWAKEKAKDSNTFIVCKDSIRQMLHGTYTYRTSDEAVVDNVAWICVQDLIKAGADVIIDECWDTISKGSRQRLKHELYGVGVINIDVIYFSSVEGNVERRLKDNHGDGSKVLWEAVKERMLLEFEPPTEEEYSVKIDIGERNE